MVGTIDLLIVAIFFLTIFIIGLKERKKITIEDYWVNSRKTNKFVLVATVTSTFIGVGALMANAGMAYSGGGLATMILLGSFFFYFLLYAKFFAPKIKEFGDNNKAYTIPDFLEYRYSKKVRMAGIILFLITYGLWLALQLLGMGIFVSAVGGFDPSIATMIGGLIVIAYTTIGGLRADIRTDVFQFVIMLSLIFIMLPIVVAKSGGLGVIFTLPKSFITGQDFAPLYVFLIGFLFLGATNFVSGDLWQRTYAADNKKNVMWSMNLSAIIVFLFIMMGALFGVYGKILIPDATANTILPEMLKMFLPQALLGIVIAGFFAAIMSSVDTVLLLMSMTLVHDLYQKGFNKKLSAERILKISRWTTFILGILGLIVALAIFNVVDIAIDALSFAIILLPTVVFGFYWKRANSNAALWSIGLGFITLVSFLFIDPVQAFIPALIVSFLTFWIVALIKK